MGVWRRMGVKNKWFRDALGRIWDKRRAAGIQEGKGHGPVAVAEKTLKDMDWRWKGGGDP